MSWLILTVPILGVLSIFAAVGLGRRLFPRAYVSKGMLRPVEQDSESDMVQQIRHQGNFPGMMEKAAAIPASPHDMLRFTNQVISSFQTPDANVKKIRSTRELRLAAVYIRKLRQQERKAAAFREQERKSQPAAD